ncbi:hypothetical protein RMSM_07201, partial [Rhodopirellula maiorica SM1]
RWHWARAAPLTRSHGQNESLGDGCYGGKEWNDNRLEAYAAL